MASTIDKMWIASDLLDSSTYRDGIGEFIRYLITNKVSGLKCPCRKCRNKKYVNSKDEMTVHLLRSRMDKSYTVWVHHGEVQTPQRLVTQQSVVETTSIGSNADTIGEDSDDDNGHMDEAAQSSTVPSKTKETKYDGLKRHAKQPLYPSSKHSTMDALVMLNDMKTECNLTEVAVQKVIEVIKESLPEGNTLGPKFHEMKCTLRETHMGCVTYDVCENNCMLFWKDDLNEHCCRKCGLSRYKVAQVSALTKRIAMGRKRKRGGWTHVPKQGRVAHKVMRYFPIIPRLQRLYNIKWIAEAMTWHHRAETNFDFMRHPCDSVDWTSANMNWRDFARDPRSVRLALSTDGFSPYGSFGAPYSCWPVILQPLNLPPSLAMKNEFSMLTVLIPGPKSPKSSIDVFLQPLIDDLNIMWKGVESWDAYKMEPFMLKAMLLWCIHDFPAYGMLSGCLYQGKVACPFCSAETPCLYLRKSRKCCYMCSRMFLPLKHKFRFEKSRQKFDGTLERRRAPRKLEGIEVEGIVSAFANVDGTLSDDIDDVESEENAPINTKGFTRRSILFELPYWSSHNTRHNLDLMHVEKNVTENILNTVLKLKGTKDTLNARADLKELNLKKKLWTVEGEDPPKTPFTLARDDKISVFKMLKHLRVPSGFSSNFANSVNITTMSFGFNSHDYHMIMQHLLPMLLMHAYPAADKVLFRAIQRISIFFNVLCAKVLCKKHLLKAKVALTEAICALEMYFPPSFFVIMIHLMHHLADEALVARPPRFRSMWTFEREMKKYKIWARNKRYIEGSIAEAYLLHEASLYAMEYKSSPFQGTHKRNLDPVFDQEDDYSGRHVGKVTEVVLTTMQYAQARKWIIKQQPGYGQWIRQYQATGRSTEESRKRVAIDDFIIWLREQEATINDARIKDIVDGPSFNVDSYNKFVCNGYSFSTVAYDANKMVQNHGVSMKALDTVGELTTYYGVIKGIFDLEYADFRVTVFYCDWIDSEDRMAFKVDPMSKLAMVSLSKVMPFDDIDAEPFILATQATQVFYSKDSKLEGWSVVLPSPKRLTKAIDSLQVDYNTYNSVLEENESLCALLDDPIDA